MKTYKNIILDVGGVLINFRCTGMLMDFGCSKEAAERITREVFDSRTGLWSRYDRGLLTPEKLSWEYAKRYPEDAEALDYFVRHGELLSVPIWLIWKKVPELKKAGYHVYLLSNYPEGLFAKHTEYADFMDYIDGKLVSYMVHTEKPEALIYQELLKRFDLKAEECLFFDDYEENVAGARKQGIDAVLVESAEQMAEVIDHLPGLSKSE